MSRRFGSSEFPAHFVIQEHSLHLSDWSQTKQRQTSFVKAIGFDGKLFRQSRKPRVGIRSSASNLLKLSTVLFSIHNEYRKNHLATCIFVDRDGRTPRYQTIPESLDMFLGNQRSQLDGSPFAYPKTICRGHLRQADTPLKFC